MTYRQLKEKIESMPEAWLDADVQVVGERTPATSAYLDKVEQDMFCFDDDGEVFFRNDLDDEELNDENCHIIAKKGDYFIFLDE